jgi:hypothetical protein
MERLQLVHEMSRRGLTAAAAAARPTEALRQSLALKLTSSQERPAAWAPLHAPVLGYLAKLSRSTGRSWKRRYFVLDFNPADMCPSLVYYSKTTGEADFAARVKPRSKIYLGEAAAGRARRAGRAERRRAPAPRRTRSRRSSGGAARSRACSGSGARWTRP